MARAPFGALALLLAACGGASSDGPPLRAGGGAPPVARAAEYPTGEGSWGKFHSKRFQVSIPLPDGRGWKIDDHSRPWLFAVHEATSSKLWLTATREDELVNRAKCEARARNMGWVPGTTLTTVEDSVTVGPEGYDSRVWVAIDAARPAGALEGHVYLFGAFIRRCLLVHLETRVASAEHEAVLSSRLATAQARLVQALTLDPPRTQEDATVPRDKPDIRR
jgi:hypothetical protein